MDRCGDLSILSGRGEKKYGRRLSGDTNSRGGGKGKRGLTSLELQDV
jgi:hypothetical protein